MFVEFIDNQCDRKNRVNVNHIVRIEECSFITKIFLITGEAIFVGVDKMNYEEINNLIDSKL